MTKKSLLTNDLIVFLTNTNSFLFSLNVVHQLLPKIKRMQNTIKITNVRRSNLNKYLIFVIRLKTVQKSIH